MGRWTSRDQSQDGPDRPARVGIPGHSPPDGELRDSGGKEVGGLLVCPRFPQLNLQGWPFNMPQVGEGMYSAESRVSDGCGPLISRVLKKLILPILPSDLVALTEEQIYRGLAPPFQQMHFRPL